MTMWPSVSYPSERGVDACRMAVMPRAEPKERPTPGRFARLENREEVIAKPGTFSRGSSAVERRTHNPLAAGSIPARATCTSLSGRDARFCPAPATVSRAFSSQPLAGRDMPALLLKHCLKAIWPPAGCGRWAFVFLGAPHWRGV